jgi:hypothetical protein
MKYKMLKDLPFIKVGEIFGKGCWSGGGWGIDKGSDSNGAHNGVQVFEQHEDKLLDRLLLNKEWIKMIPESACEAVNLYEEKYIRKDELLEIITLTPKEK